MPETPGEKVTGETFFKNLDHVRKFLFMEGYKSVQGEITEEARAEHETDDGWWEKWAMAWMQRRAEREGREVEGMANIQEDACRILYDFVHSLKLDTRKAPVTSQDVLFFLAHIFELHQAEFQRRSGTSSQVDRIFTAMTNMLERPDLMAFEEFARSVLLELKGINHYLRSFRPEAIRRATRENAIPGPAPSGTGRGAASTKRPATE